MRSHLIVIIDRYCSSMVFWTLVPVLAGIIFLFTNYYVLHRTKNEATQGIRDDIAGRSKLIAKSVEQYFSGKREIVDLMVDFEPIKKYLHTATQKTLETNEYCKATQALLKSANGADKGAAISWIASLMDEFSMSYDVFSLEERDQWKTRERPWYVGTMKTNGVYMVDPYVDIETNELCISLVKKIYDEGIVVGFAGIDLFFPPIDKIMESFVDGENGYPVMLGRDGILLYHPYREHVFKKKLSDFDESLVNVARDMTAGRSGVRIVSIDGIPKYLGFSPIAGTNWSIGMVYSKEVAEEPVRLFGRSLWIATLLNILSLVLPVALFSLIAISRNHSFLDMKKLYDLAVNRMQIGVAVIAQETGKCELLNNAYREFLGLKDANETPTLGNILDTLWNSHSVIGSKESFVFSKIARDWEDRLQEKNELTIGDRFFTHQFTSFYDYAGKEKFLSVLTEITELKKMQETLRDAKEQAESANRAKSSFLANMSHEIRTPMNGVIGLTNLLASSGLNEKQSQYIELIQQSTESLLTIINDILDYSKIEAGKISIEPRPFNLRLLLEEIVFSFEMNCRKKGIDFHLSIDEAVPMFVVGDSHRLRQILLNFLSNALKFTSSGRISLRVLPTTAEQESNLVRFEIQDSGIGISDEVQKILFRPFTQADESTTRRFGGTGLGLSICSLLAELLGGEVGCQSELGKGALFWFTIILRPTTEQSLAAMPTALHVPVSTRKLRVLLVDDVKVNLLVLGTMVRDLGHMVEMAENGGEAIDKLRQDHFDVVFMDCQMPLMDGYQCTKEIRTSPNLKRNDRVPIIAVTANAMTGDRERCLEAGMDDYISKPIDPKELVEKIAQWGNREPRTADSG